MVSKTVLTTGLSETPGEQDGEKMDTSELLEEKEPAVSTLTLLQEFLPKYVLV